MRSNMKSSYLIHYDLKQYTFDHVLWPKPIEKILTQILKKKTHKKGNIENIFTVPTKTEKHLMTGKRRKMPETAKNTGKHQ